VSTTPEAIAYTDGSCIGNPGPGGWGVHVELPDGRVFELGGGELATTNNRMELRAAIEAIRATAGQPAVRVITDSAYVRNGVTSWLAGWKRNGWRTRSGQPVENQPLWSELDALADGPVTWEWTRSHVGTPGNERCDAIARWFASCIRSLRLPAGEAAPAARRRPAAPAGTRYLSLVDGVVARHESWADCERRVHGVRGARFRKVRGDDEERATLAAWGVTPGSRWPEGA
jgi:ribonuclease HI